jgi:hypothetical protein
MITKESHQLLAKASWIVEQIFRERGKILPMYHVVTRRLAGSNPGAAARP